MSGHPSPPFAAGQRGLLRFFPRVGTRPAVAVSTAIALGAALAACNTANLNLEGPAPNPVAVAAPAVAVNIAELPGNWGLASYHQDKDRDRTVTAAKAACSNPYKIGKGSNGGVMMYLADQSQPSELFVKTTSDGRSFIGPRGAPGLPQDRVVTFDENGVLITVWLDQSARERYGTMVLVKCT
jgi:hypothetical protein